MQPGDTVVVLGCGPVGLLAQKMAWLKGAKRVVAVDYIDYRLEHARRYNQVEIMVLALAAMPTVQPRWLQWVIETTSLSR